MSFFTTTILLGLLTAGTLSMRSHVFQVKEVVRFASGRTEKVSVLNGGSYYCPYHCRVNHRHLVHDAEWICDESQSCGHFLIDYGTKPGNQRNMTGSRAYASPEEETATITVQPGSKH